MPKHSSTFSGRHLRCVCPPLHSACKIFPGDWRQWEEFLGTGAKSQGAVWRQTGLRPHLAHFTAPSSVSPTYLQPLCRGHRTDNTWNPAFKSLSKDRRKAKHTRYAMSPQDHSWIWRTETDTHIPLKDAGENVTRTLFITAENWRPSKNPITQKGCVHCVILLVEY